MDEITFMPKGKSEPCSVEGRFILGPDEPYNSVVFEGRDSRYYILPKSDVRKTSSDETPFTYFDKKEFRVQLENEFPKRSGYSILETENFFVVYTTSRAFADWYAKLLEKVFKDYLTFWKGKGLELKKPEYSLVAVVLSNRPMFFKYGAAEEVQVDEIMHAYYSKAANRIVICDISGIETQNEGDSKRATSRDIREFLNQPGAGKNIAAVVHEATHQLGFNTGMHPRYGNYPLWICEGIAVFHEVPDAKNRDGWTVTAKPNGYRLAYLRNYFNRNPQEPLQTIIRSDAPLKDVKTGLNHYAVAWGLTYYLIMKRPKDFVRYLEKMSKKDFFSDDSPELRIEEFEEHFGKDWRKIEDECKALWKKI